ncbi:ABC-three component system middle component 7 [Arcanobacterium hippocoleae]
MRRCGVVPDANLRAIQTKEADTVIRLPNKLYRFNESVLADFVTILKTLGSEPVPVLDLQRRLADKLHTEDLIDALALLLTLGAIHLDASKGVILRAH